MSALTRFIHGASYSQRWWALALLAHACAFSGPKSSSPAADGSASFDDAGTSGEACGYRSRGHVLQIGTEIALCLPSVTCTPSETCQRGLGDCVAGQCIFKPGYHGLATLGEAWATYYCDLTTGGCDGSVIAPRPYELAKSISARYGSVCADQPEAMGTCVGVAASPPAMVGNSQIATDPATG